MRALVWFRQDLRVQDNKALYYAIESDAEDVMAIYYITPEQWRIHQQAGNKIDFILRGLSALREELEKIHIPLIVHTVDRFSQCVDHLEAFCVTEKIDTVFFNDQYEVNEKKRDESAIRVLERNKIRVLHYVDHLIIPSSELLTQKKEAFKVFTPFKKKWIECIKETDYSTVSSVKKKKRNQRSVLSLGDIPTSIAGFSPTADMSLWPAGEVAAMDRLHFFINNHIEQYDEARNFPLKDATSRLSPYLATGMISPRVCFKAAVDCNRQKVDQGNPGVLCWIGELIWREFYHSIIHFFPRVSRHKPFKLFTEKLHWDKNELFFDRWKNGKTGFPIIDAAMRQLKQEGWMHNRLRMIVAMFLTKNAWLDWRLGERYFMEQLIDGDLAANNGGWQWSASTGTDAVPYFRVFNPVLQSERYDPDGFFIRQYCPELESFDRYGIHDPSSRDSLLLGLTDYPRAMLDLSETRKKAISAFKQLNL